MIDTLPTKGNGLDRFLSLVSDALGAGAINLSAETKQRYGETTLPGPDQPPSAVVYPTSTADVQVIVSAANATKTPLYPISNGLNIGIGSRAPVRTGQVVVDLGRKMNRILNIDDDMGIAVVEPGVSFRQLYEELERRGGKFMIDPTSGPPEGSVLGNTLDKGAGYTPYADHFGMSCGMEIVLGNGQTLRTGDGSMPNARNWHMSKYIYGPFLDGLFAQSNYGIVTSIGLWLMPKPPCVRAFAFTFNNDDDIGDIVEAIRPLRMSGFVPTMMRLSNDMWMLTSEEPYPNYREGVGALSDDERRALQKRHGLGAWTVSGAFYGASADALAPQIDRVCKHFRGLGKGRFIPHDEAASMPPLAAAIAAYSGQPSLNELKQLSWRPGGGLSAFTPGVPMERSLVNECSKMSREILTRHGLEYVKMYVCGPRFARGLHHLIWNRSSKNEDDHADAAYRELVAGYAAKGLQSGRAPLRYQDLHMSLLQDTVRDTCTNIKNALDPNGIIAPGRYGIG